MSRGRSESAVAEQVQRDDAVAACGQRPRQRLVHPARQQQPVEQDDDAIPVAELVVRQIVGSSG